MERSRLQAAAQPGRHRQLGIGLIRPLPLRVLGSPCQHRRSTLATSSYGPASAMPMAAPVQVKGAVTAGSQEAKVQRPWLAQAVGVALLVPPILFGLLCNRPAFAGAKQHMLATTPAPMAQEGPTSSTLFGGSIPTIRLAPVREAATAAADQLMTAWTRPEVRALSVVSVVVAAAAVQQVASSGSRQSGGSQARGADAYGYKFRTVKEEDRLAHLDRLYAEMERLKKRQEAVAALEAAAKAPAATVVVATPVAVQVTTVTSYSSATSVSIKETTAIMPAVVTQTVVAKPSADVDQQSSGHKVVQVIEQQLQQLQQLQQNGLSGSSGVNGVNGVAAATAAPNTGSPALPTASPVPATATPPAPAPTSVQVVANSAAVAPVEPPKPASQGWWPWKPQQQQAQASVRSTPAGTINGISSSGSSGISSSGNANTDASTSGSSNGSGSTGGVQRGAVDQLQLQLTEERDKAATAKAAQEARANVIKVVQEAEAAATAKAAEAARANVMKVVEDAQMAATAKAAVEARANVIKVVQDAQAAAAKAAKEAKAAEEATRKRQAAAERAAARAARLAGAVASGSTDAPATASYDVLGSLVKAQEPAAARSKYDLWSAVATAQMSDPGDKYDLVAAVLSALDQASITAAAPRSNLSADLTERGASQVQSVGDLMMQKAAKYDTFHSDLYAALESRPQPAWFDPLQAMLSVDGPAPSKYDPLSSASAAPSATKEDPFAKYNPFEGWLASISTPPPAASTASIWDPRTALSAAAAASATPAPGLSSKYDPSAQLTQALTTLAEELESGTWAAKQPADPLFGSLLDAARSLDENRRRRAAASAGAVVEPAKYDAVGHAVQSLGELGEAVASGSFQKESPQDPFVKGLTAIVDSLNATGKDLAQLLPAGAADAISSAVAWPIDALLATARSSVAAAQASAAEAAADEVASLPGPSNGVAYTQILGDREVIVVVQPGIRRQ